jgi:hypothetical protein
MDIDFAGLRLGVFHGWWYVAWASRWTVRRTGEVMEGVISLLELSEIELAYPQHHLPSRILGG